MDDALKRVLLERKFRSIEYMEEMRDYHQAAIDALVNAIQHFYAHPPSDEDWQNWPLADQPDAWEDRVLKNFKGTHNSIEKGIINAKAGKLSTIRSASGSLHSIFGNLYNMSWRWLEAIDPSYEADFRKKLVQANRNASNIWREVGEYWKTPGSILDEEITGPMDEQDLLRYLKPGENP